MRCGAAGPGLPRLHLWADDEDCEQKADERHGRRDNERSVHSVLDELGARGAATVQTLYATPKTVKRLT